MRVNGDHEKIGNWDKGSGPKDMQLSINRQSWIKSEKYGMKVRPYETFCKFKNEHWGKSLKIRYNYSKKTLDRVDWEREPCREMVIADPS
jgi:hypothetical protein